MSIQPAILEKLEEFKTRNKFSADKWEERGIIPSGEDICSVLQQKFDTVSSSLINALNNDKPAKNLKAILKKGLNYFKIEDYDTEEKEFIGDLFFELAGILQIEDFGKALDRWLYGEILKKQKPISREDAREIRSQPCTKCGVLLETYATELDDKIPETNWLIGLCNNCKEPNLLRPGGGIKALTAGNYIIIGSPHMQDYTLEQANEMLEQMKNFKM